MNAIRVKSTSAQSMFGLAGLSTHATEVGCRRASATDRRRIYRASRSFVVPTWHGVGKAQSTIKAYDGYRAEHERLVADGSIAVENGKGRVARDIVFGSPSTAGAVCLGRSCNGRREWIAPDGTMFGAWETGALTISPRTSPQATSAMTRPQV